MKTTVAFESVEEFLARGGQVTVIDPKKAYGAQKKQTIKRAYRKSGF